MFSFYFPTGCLTKYIQLGKCTLLAAAASQQTNVADNTVATQVSLLLVLFKTAINYRTAKNS